ncbi:hypothetical protein M422DRAFT_98501, partial [Sphaerobolus stellatus SS14]
HNFSIEPTTNTFSFYIVYMCHHIKPASVGVYLSGICHSLEPYFPNVHSIHSSAIVTHSLAGMKKLHGLQATSRKHALNREDLIHIISHLPSVLSHECLLFVAMLLTGFYGLLCLGELTFPDSTHKRSSKKLTLRHTLILEATHFSFILPFHKADQFYAGNTVMIEALPHSPIDPLFHLQHYLDSGDRSFPFFPALWLTSQGKLPTYSWFVGQLQSFLGTDIAGHSLRSGGTTALALAGVPDNAIQATGCWSSDTWHI